VHQILELARHTKKDKVELKPRLLVKEMEKFLLSTLPKTVLVQSSLCVDEPTVHASPSHLFQSLLNLSLLAYSKTLSPRCSISLEINTVSKNRKRYARISVEGKRSAGQYPQTTLRSLQEFCSEITAVPQETAYSSIELLAADSCGTFTIEEDQPHRYAASIELPIQTTETIIEKASAEKRNANESKNRIQNKQSIIIVDPDANVRDMLAEHLTSNGYVCHNAVDGAEALMMAGRLGDDLCSIFCELELSHIDGATLANALREKTDVHVHAFTASERQFKEAVKNRDLFQSVSKKPIQISRLEDLIQPYDSIKSESASS
ncbi:MAG: response regulator, partial [Verrucomicrobiota bacterium]